MGAGRGGTRESARNRSAVDQGTLELDFDLWARGPVQEGRRALPGGGTARSKLPREPLRLRRSAGGPRQVPRGRGGLPEGSGDFPFPRRSPEQSWGPAAAAG